MFDEANSVLETNNSTQNKLISNAFKNWHYSNKTDLLEFGIHKLMTFSLESNLLVGDLLPMIPYTSMPSVRKWDQILKNLSKILTKQVYY